MEQRRFHNTEAEQPRKAFEIRADGHAPGVCEACGDSIVWTWTRKGKAMPMNRGFEIAEYVPVTIAGSRGPVSLTLLRVYAGDTHFATCEARKAAKVATAGGVA